MRQRNRQAATKKAVLRRLADARLESLTDSRGRRGRRYRHRALVNGLALGSLAACSSVREVEELTGELSHEVRRELGIPGRISDTKLHDTAVALSASELRSALHRQVKAEHRRGNLKPQALSLGLAAIDGKGLGKFSRWDDPDVVRVQPEKGLPYGLARVHRAHLVSAAATVVLDERPIPGDTNEMGAVCSFTSELLAAYEHTELFEAIMVDAGNASLEHATLIHDHHLGYIFALKQPSGDIYAEALRQLAPLAEPEAEAIVRVREKGATIVYRLWRVRLPAGFLTWRHARQLVRVQRVVEKPGADTTVEGDRYFATNLPWGRLDGRAWLKVLRLYWRCENEGHWTADVVWREDARRTPWTQHPRVAYALSLLRMIALNIVAVLRALSRRDYESKRIPWRSVVRLLRFELTAPSIVFRGSDASN